MDQQPDAFLIVEKGDPHQKGQILPLPSSRVLLGRTWESHQPDISFDSLHISRRHAVIACVDGRYTVTDQPESKHGTIVNDRQLEKNVPCPLQDGDRMVLGRGEVELLFYSSVAPGVTLDYRDEASCKDAEAGLALNEDRVEVLLNGRVVIRGNTHEYRLFRLLWLNRGRAVDFDTIKKEVWGKDRGNKRVEDERGIADVSDYEMQALVHRLRDRLGEGRGLLRNLPRYGYLLEDGS